MRSLWTWLGLMLCGANQFAHCEPGWWMREPIRWVQTNLRETDATLDAARLVDDLAGMRANVLLIGMGGIAAFYPTSTPFHYSSPYLPPGKDAFGDVLRLAHARGIRVVGRLDFSKTKKAVFVAHPEWFFRKSDGTPVFRWLADNEKYYMHQRSAARVLLLHGPASTGKTYSLNSYRGLFRLLSEEHVPFAVSDNMDWLGKRQFDLILATDWAPRELTRYLDNGGRVLIVSPQQPDFPVAPVVKTWSDLKGYFRVREHDRLPSLKDTDLIMTNGSYTEVKPDTAPWLTLVPPSMIGPPEFVHLDIKDTDKPGLVFASRGAGKIAWIPWDLAGLYYRESLPAHAALFRDVMDRLNPDRQLITNAHPLAEITWMRQDKRQLIHLVNLSGHSQTGYFPPVPMNNIRIKMAGTFTRAETLRNPQTIPIKLSDGFSEFTVPKLSDYELVVLE
jgi:Hypothetical glycosyl hydrolase 6